MSTHSHKWIVRKLFFSLILLGLLTGLTPEWGFAATQAAKSAEHASSIGTPFPVANFAALGPAAGITSEQRNKALEMLDLSPAVFVENKGQWDPAVRYGFDGKGTRVSFTDSGPVFQMVKSAGDDCELSQAVFSARFVGAKTVEPVGLEKSASKTNYYIGNDSSKWHSDVPSFQRVAYYGIYDGVDLYTWGKRSGLKYEFHVAPGKSFESIVIRYDGIEGLSLDERGALHVKTSLGEMVDEAPVVYQETPSGRRDVQARFRVIDESSYGFRVTGDIDGSLPLVIDPTLAWSTLLGGNNYDYISGIAIDSTGNAWVAGYTKSPDFPVTPGAIQTTLVSGNDAFVAEISPTGTLILATFLGGAGDDYANGIAVDADDNVWVAGMTNSANFPLQDAIQGMLGSFDAFIAKITPQGALAYSTYLGGNTSDGGATAHGVSRGRAIAVDSTGDAWIVGDTNATDFPVTAGAFQATCGGTYDAFIAEITPAGTLAWASYLGGALNDMPTAIAMGKSNNAWVVGYTNSTDFPVTPDALQSTLANRMDVYIAEITLSGTLSWASFLGGSSDDYAAGVAVDSTGDAWVTGYTSSTNFPTHNPFQASNAGGLYDALVLEITPGHALGFSTYIGGSISASISAADYGMAIAVDSTDGVWVSGTTYSTDFPTLNGFQPLPGGRSDAFVLNITPQGTMAWGSLMGGDDYDNAGAIAADASGNVWMAGYTQSPNFPVLGGFQTSRQGPQDAFIARIGPGPSGPLSLAITTTSLPDATVNVYYEQTVSGFGGVPPYTWSIALGSLPAGLTIDSSTGIVSGAATRYETASFTVQVVDSATTPATATKALSITVLPAGSSAELNWLEIDKFRMTLPGPAGKDSFVLQGSFNMPVTGNLPETVTLTIDGWSAVMDSSSWKRAGSSNVYTYKQGNVVGKMTYWVKGTTKCLFTFTASKQTLQGSLPNLPNVPVRLQVGSDFDETLTAALAVKGAAAKLASVGPAPLFWPQKLTITRKPTKASMDSLAFSGKLILAAAFDPSTDAVTMSIGPYAVSLPAGTLPAPKGGVIKYTAATTHGKMSIQINTKTGALVVVATGVDLSAAAAASGVSLAITNQVGADWDYGFMTAPNKTNTSFKY